MTSVIKRNGKEELVDFNKVHLRIKRLIKEPYPLTQIDDFELAKLSIGGLNNGIKTKDIDIYTANISSSLSIHNYEYGKLASRIVINNHHKNTLNSFKDKMQILYLRKDADGISYPLIDSKFYKFVEKNQNAIDKYIDYSRDYKYDFFGFKTLERGYLLGISDYEETKRINLNKKEGDEKEEVMIIIERPQDLLMRVAIAMYIPNKVSEFKNPKILKTIFSVYDALSNFEYVHATPTLFNAGTVSGSLTSCFLLGSEDSLEGIMKTLTDAVRISKKCGGVGYHFDWRGNGSLIRGTNGVSNGIVPFHKMFNQGARAFNQGGKRMGSFAAYIEPHHPDIMDFLELRKNVGKDELRCRDLFLAVWIPDLFMHRMKNNETWSLFCPNECPKLNTTYGKEYEELYIKYELEGRARRVIPARDIWYAIFESQMESGIPYIMYKDNVNRCNMQNNLGTIRSSNLCTEITLYSDSNEYSCCNLSSICVQNYVEDKWSLEELELPENERRILDHEFPLHPWMNYKKLAEAASNITLNLNNVIDRTYYPVLETARSNFRHRPIGIGIQGLADLFMKFRIPFTSVEARDINKKISEAIYYGALSKSTEICRNIYKELVKELNNDSKVVNSDSKVQHPDKKVYKYYPKSVLETYPELKDDKLYVSYSTVDDIPKTIGAYPSYLINGGCHMANGKFHWELYGLDQAKLSGLFDWESLRVHIAIYGVRNSLLTAYMPTASTSSIMGATPCFEPLVNNLFKKKVLAGEHIIVNKYLMKDLHEAGIWSTTIKDYINLNNGSIQDIEGIPQKMKDIYKTIWEIPVKDIINMAVDRQPFIDQSQSMNLFMDDFSLTTFNKAQMHAWTKGLKTGSYYIRTRPAVMPQKFTIDPDSQKKMELRSILLENERSQTINTEEEETCLLCSS